MQGKAIGKSRRDFLALSAATAGVYLLQSCAQPATPAATATKAPATAAPQATAAAAKAATQAPAAATAAATAAAAGMPKKGGSLRLARTAGHKNFNGVDMVRSNFSFTRALYNSLVRLDAQLNPQPELAEKWSFSSDGLTMTLNLRQGVKFHSGRDFTSDDVKFTWEYSKDPVTGSPQMRTLFSLIKDVKTPDKFTAQLSFDKPQAVIFDILDIMCIVDRTAVEKLSTNDAGSGPFMVTKYVPNDEVVMQRFPDYWDKGKPYLDEYVLKTTPDAAAMVLSLESKALDVIWAPPLHEVARLKSVAGLATHPGGGAQGMFFVGANVRQGPLANKKARQAINFAIDRARCVRTALSDTVEPTCLMVPKNSWAYFADLENKYTYDLNKAKALLAEAGFANGFEVTLMLSSKDNPPQRGIAEVLQADLTKIGVRAKIEDVEAAVGNTRTNKGEFELLVWQYGRANRDPGTMMSGSIFWQPGAQTGAIGFDSADYVKWRDQGQTVLERAQRLPLYRSIQEFILEESFVMPVAGNASFFIMDNRVKGLTTNQESSPFVGEMWWDK
ncbi:MAG: ABC transporter substrate-binding protein [Chloroflexota bacterium]